MYVVFQAADSMWLVINLLDEFNDAQRDALARHKLSSMPFATSNQVLGCSGPRTERSIDSGLDECRPCLSNIAQANSLL